jgi:hypothetical protein
LAGTAATVQRVASQRRSAWRGRGRARSRRSRLSAATWLAPRLSVILPGMPIERIKSMKHLLTGVAVVAALAFSVPVWAQQPGGNAMGMPGPNPGGPGLTPYSSGPRTTAAPPPSAPPPAMAPSAMPPSSMSDTSSAMPPKHHRASRHASHGKMAGHHRGKGPQLTGSTADQLNQEELSRLQAGNMSMPAAPGMAPPSSGNSQLNRMPAGGRATSGTAR